MTYQKTCAICGNIFSTYYRLAQTCSASCKKELFSRKAEARYTQHLTEPVADWLFRRYVRELASYQDLMKDLGLTNVRTLMAMMRRYNIPVRNPSEAVATQYVRNPARRDRAREVFLANNLAPIKGQPNQAQRPGVGRKISAAKTGHPMYRSHEWKLKVSRSFQRLAQEQPETMIERRMRLALSGAAIPFVSQVAVDAYVLDFAITEPGIDVECDGAYWHEMPDKRARDARRDRDLSALGWTVLRFSEIEIQLDIGRCIETIRAALKP